MKLSISNIAWEPERDDEVYQEMERCSFQGLEIAPTRLFPEKPYEHISEAEDWALSLKRKYGLSVCSMQSIWYGMKQRIAGSSQERETLLSYTKGALRFASAISCRNIVFGCPRNRCVNNPEDKTIIEQFLVDIAELALAFDIVIALEPNPTIYNTNFINTTGQALELLRRLNHPALKLNLDIGTVLANHEKLNWTKEEIAWVNHVHISEPGLGLIQKRMEHTQLRRVLEKAGYDKFVSIEMKKGESLKKFFNVLHCVKTFFEDSI